MKLFRKTKRFFVNKKNDISFARQLYSVDKLGSIAIITPMITSFISTIAFIVSFAVFKGFGSQVEAMTTSDLSDLSIMFDETWENFGYSETVNDLLFLTIIFDISVIIIRAIKKSGSPVVTTKELIASEVKAVVYSFIILPFIMMFTQNLIWILVGIMVIIFLLWLWINSLDGVPVTSAVTE